MKLSLVPFAIFAFASATAACSSSSSPSEAPALTALVYSPDTLTVGAQGTVSGTVHFDDAQGDVSELDVDLRLANGQTAAIAPTAVDSASQTSGTLQFQLTIQPPDAETFSFDLWVVDKAGHKSNVLTGTLTSK